MATSTQWQLAREAAVRYEQIAVPSILGPFACALVDWSSVQSGETVLDVGCGTGAATRYAAEQAGPSGRVIGVDINAGMIDVAQSLPLIQGAAIEWHENSVYELPLGAQAVDVALCAQTLQFLNDRLLALTEMYRVLKPGGRVALSLWCDIQESPYFHVLAEALGKHIGRETAAGLKAGFGLSQADEIRALLVNAGFHSIEMTVKQLNCELPKLRDFVRHHISATPMAAGFNAASPPAQQAVVREVSEQLASYEADAGVRVPFKSHLAAAVK